MKTTTKKNWTYVVCALVVAIVSIQSGRAAEMPENGKYTNFVGMEFVRVEPGVFQMGVGKTPLPAELAPGGSLLPEGDYDEKPNHTVTISRPFHIGKCEVTNLQYELFRPDHRKLRRGGDSGRDDEAVVNVNWYDAQAFCRWLSDKEGLPYRLPTEAEWEYACRAGTTTPFSMGDALPQEFSRQSRSVQVGQTPPNPWGLYDIHGNVEEWCYDWYGPYEAADQTDPVGRFAGDFKVIRGGDRGTDPYYQRSANRLGTLPEDKHGIIGFRVFIGEMPDTKPLPKAPLAPYQIGVNQQVPADIDNGPDPREPYIRIREFVKMPPGNTGPLYEKHNHFTSVTECPNGDLIAIWHTCIGESGRELAVAASRLRYGRQEWEPASPFWDAPDRNDHGHAMWFDGKERIYHFQGVADTVRNVALVMRTSSDNGVAWSQPRIIAGHGSSRMPVESVFRTKEGFYAISCDKGPNILWISRDRGISWSECGGAIRGKHATAVQLSDGRLMALGREGNIDGKMPMSISGDMGRTWEYSASEFPPVSWGQRAVLLRLKEGPLFFASFCNKMMITNASGSQHEVSGLFGAVSFDEGKTWPQKRLVTNDGPAHQVGSLNGEPIIMSPHNTESVGYLAVCQTPDGVINLLTSRQHCAFNLKWVMTLPPAAPTRPTPSDAKALPGKERLEKVYILSESMKRAEWFARSENFAKPPSSDRPLKISNEGGGFYERGADPAGFAAVDDKKGFTVELKTKVIKRKPEAKAVDIELYDGAGSRYALAITDTGVYWYEGYIQGSAFLPLAEFVPVAEGMDNTDDMHVYRMAVRPDRVAQIYRDGRLIGARQHEYRTPREAYIQLGAGPGAEVLVEYFAYDLGGPYQP
ncbi:MAG TPA: SUMF1/EgtB/PvdO family nonheme iron enzyme [Sedimentisphaerales bacterium]|nr:SUMF1/EgtB/PvdO family nonheme iron enzyme [Sedimentisphaerales bacterium]